MLHVIATIQLAPGRRADFLKEFHALVPLVRAEEGCLEYGPTVDSPTSIPAQGVPRADVVTVIEKWASVAALLPLPLLPAVSVMSEPLTFWLLPLWICA